MNEFGGDWTKIKIEILVEYASAYLTIMNQYKQFNLIYFDGFAGSGFIQRGKKTKVEVTVGAARRIIELNKPKAFDMYYFVEKDPKFFSELEINTKLAFPQKTIHTICDDCNKKLIDLANFLRKSENTNYRTLAYIDPCGMQLEWRAIEYLKGLPIDLWVLVPTGLGVNRLLKKNGNISNSWTEKLVKFLGLSKEEIANHFYKETPSLFEDINLVTKEKDAIKMSAKLYHKKLKEVFDFVSSPYELKNSTNSTMYHLFLTSNNKTAVKIGDDIVKKYNS